MRFQDVSGDLGKFQRFQGTPRAFSKFKVFFQSSRGFREFDPQSSWGFRELQGLREVSEVSVSFRVSRKFHGYQRVSVAFREFPWLQGVPYILR